MRGDESVLVEGKGLWKRFCRDLKRSFLYAGGDIWQEVIRRRPLPVALRKGEFWALKDVSIQLKRGEAVALVGRNGCGKTTLLRVLAGLITKTAGELRVAGQIAPLPANMIGLRPVLTGRENAVTMMTILGLSPGEAKAKCDWVLDFAEIGEAGDTPLGRFSSGMSARLAFGCALAAKPDIYILDEVLAVGDVKFRAKCRAELEEHKKRGGAFFFVSHDSNAVQSFCNRAVYIDKGRVKAEGHPAEIMRIYENDIGMDLPSHVIYGNAPRYLAPRPDGSNSAPVRVSEIELRDGGGIATEVVRSGEPFSFRLRLEASNPAEFLHVSVSFNSLSGMQTELTSVRSRSYQIGHRGVFWCEIRFPACVFAPGWLMAQVHLQEGDRILAEPPPFRFRVVSESPPSTYAAFIQPALWPESLEIEQGAA